MLRLQSFPFDKRIGQKTVLSFTNAGSETSVGELKSACAGFDSKRAHTLEFVQVLPIRTHEFQPLHLCPTLRPSLVSRQQELAPISASNIGATLKAPFH